MFKFLKIQICTRVLHSFDDERNKTLCSFKQKELSFSNCRILFITTLRHSAEIYLSYKTWFMVGNNSQHSRRKKERQILYSYLNGLLQQSSTFGLWNKVFYLILIAYFYQYITVFVTSYRYSSIKEIFLGFLRR